jgi:hypothetical protein
MYNWGFLFKNLGQFQQILKQQIRTVFVFLILYLIILFPTLQMQGTATFLLIHLLILQGLCIICVIMQVDPLLRSDVEEGFLDLWLGNQGLGFQYYMVRQLFIGLEIILPVVMLLVLLMPTLSVTGKMVFCILSFVNMLITSLWASSLSLLLAKTHDIGQSLVGMVLAALLLIPQLLVGETILEALAITTIAMSQLWLYAGVSIISIALNLSLAPSIVRLSVNH